MDTCNKEMNFYFEVFKFIPALKMKLIGEECILRKTLIMDKQINATQLIPDGRQKFEEINLGPTYIHDF